MRFRSVQLVFPCVLAASLLTGCSALSNFSWSSLPPFNWFGSKIEVSDAGVGGLNGGTPLAQEPINKALNGNYRLRSGMGTNNGQITAFYQALDGDQIKLLISGKPKAQVNRVEVMDAKIASVWGVKIGDAFSAHYSKVFEVCQLAKGDDARSVECIESQSKHVSYLYSGDWNGPEGLMPSDDILQSWHVSKIIWYAQARD
ncbi:MAG: RpoE-regulated lipoprotein [Symbiopectobacterium sp.]|uniref:RpoE-regulated lipoprotein n=1 Tax=Symbiopectobacterium sp. TaxID=2952789 RepID=UPI0039EB36B2